MNLIQCFQKNSSWYKGARRNGRPVGILWHDTGAGNPYLKRYVQPHETDANYAEMIKLLGKNHYNNDWNHTKREAGLNAWIGKLADGSVATIQAGEWDIHAWGCGGGTKGSCNGYTKTSAGTTWIKPFWIQFEICDDGYKDKAYFEKVYKEACEFTAYICKQFNIDPNGTVVFNGVKVPTIICHQDSYKYQLGSNHGDVYLWFNKMGKTMDDVRKDVAALLGATTPVVKPDEPQKPTTIYRVQVGAFSNKSNADKLVVELKSKGYDAFVTSTPAAPEVAQPAGFVVGDKVKCNDGVTKFSNGVKMSSFVPKATLYVRAVESSGKVLLVSTEPVKTVYTGRVNASDVHKI